MRLKNYFRKNGTVGTLLAATLLMLTSCGSYEYVSYNDGIYNDGNSSQNYEPATRTPNTAPSSYYSNYFAEKSAQYDAAAEDGTIFTDIDNYSSENYDPADSTNVALQYEKSQPSWGSDSDNVTVNVYNNGWNNRPFWGAGYGYGGFYDPFWYGGGYGWRLGFGNPYWRGGFYGGGFYGGFYNGFHHPYYYNNFAFRGNRYIAYNRGYRRGYLANSYRNRRIYNSRAGYRSRSYANRNTYNRRTRSYNSSPRRSSNNRNYNNNRSRSYSNNRSATPRTNRYRSYRNNGNRSSTSRSRNYNSSRSRNYNSSRRSSNYSRSGRSSGSRSRSYSPSRGRSGRR